VGARFKPDARQPPLAQPPDRRRRPALAAAAAAAAAAVGHNKRAQQIACGGAIAEVTVEIQFFCLDARAIGGPTGWLAGGNKEPAGLTLLAASDGSLGQISRPYLAACLQYSRSPVSADSACLAEPSRA